MAIRRLHTRHLGECGNEPAPVLALRREHRAPGLGDAVVAATALPGLLDPSPLDERALLEAVERGVKRGHRETHRATRAKLDLAADFVAVMIGLVHEGKDEEIGAALPGAFEDRAI